MTGMVRRNRFARPSLRTLLSPTALMAGGCFLALGVLTDRPGAAEAMPQSMPHTAPPSAPLLPRTLHIDGDGSLNHLNQALKTQFEQRFNQNKIQLDDSGSTAALAALAAGRLDIAAIGRPLTAAEQAQGLVALRIGTQKVAIVVSRTNPFSGSLTNQQFAQILNGTLTNWSQVGGPNAPIRLVDHPQTSDTRQALERYPVLGMAWAPNATSTTIAGSLSHVSPETLTQLGPTGISYRIADQVLGNPDLKVLPLHNVGPDDGRYSFSQPLFYVYKGQGTAAVQAFLTELRQPNLIASLADPALAAAMAVNAVAGPAAEALPGAPIAKTATTPSTTTPSTTTRSTAPQVSPVSKVAPAPFSAAPGPKPATKPEPQLVRSHLAPKPHTGWSFPWAWLPWLAPLLGLPLLAAWLLRDRSIAPAPILSLDEPVDFNPQAAPASTRTRLVFVPRDCRMGYAYWELSDEVKQQFKVHPSDRLALRLYDRSPDSGLSADAYQQFESLGTDCDRFIPIPRDDRRYRLELGHIGLDRVWQKLATAEQIHVPACAIAPSLPQPDLRQAALAQLPPQAEPVAEPVLRPGMPDPGELRPNPGPAVVPAPAFTLTQSSISATSTSQSQAFAWRLAPSSAQRSRITIEPQADQSALVRWHIDEAEQAQMLAKGGKQLALRVCDVTSVDLAQSPPNHCLFHRCNPEDRSAKISLSDRSRDYVAELGYVSQDGRWLSLAHSEPMAQASSPVVPETATQTAVAIATANVVASERVPQDVNSRIVLIPCRPHQVSEAERWLPHAYAYWNLSEDHKQHLRDQGGRQLVLRVYDADHINLDYQTPHSVIEVACDDSARDRIVEVPLGDRDYVAELGYVTADNQFLSLGRSVHAHIPLNVMASF
jgi:phosphate transport system substrate-binding protein